MQDNKFKSHLHKFSFLALDRAVVGVGVGLALVKVILLKVSAFAPEAQEGKGPIFVEK